VGSGLKADNGVLVQRIGAFPCFLVAARTWGGSMSKGRLEAFSDGVIAIIITIMVLEMKVPHEDRVEELLPLLPTFLSYVLSFVYVGIYWNNHHHLLHTCTAVTGAMLWANLHLLFWLSLLPFATGWMGENHFSAAPTILYGIVLLLAAIAYSLLEQVIMHAQGKNSLLKEAVGREAKSKVSVVLYLIAIMVALRSPRIADAMFVAAALLWLVPDRRIEERLSEPMANNDSNIRTNMLSQNERVPGRSE
jgi:uncharacterized membrane protein